MSPDRIRPGSAGQPVGEPEDDAPADLGAPQDLEGASEELEGAEELEDAETDDTSPATALLESASSSAGAAGDRSDGASWAPLAVGAVGAVGSDDRAGDEIGDVPLDAHTMRRSDGTHRRLFTRIYYGETRIDFVRRKRIWFTFSAVVILVGLISLSTRGLNLGIEFVGGTSWTVASKTLTVQQVETALGTVLPGPVVTVLGTNSTGSRSIQVEAKLPKGQSIARQEALASTVSSDLGRIAHVSANEVSTESVGPSWGGEITKKAIIALIVFFILIALYISIFFEFRMAMAAIVAVAHDVLVTVGIYSLSGFEVTPDTVVAFLTILGYSLYDTIVVFDRIRDNVKNLSVRDRMTYSDVVNLSMNQTLARSLNTSLVAIMPILAVLVIGAELLGASTLQYFGLALLVGLTTGAYSSIFIASPLVAVMKEREPRYVQLRERLALRGVDRVLLSASEVASGSFGEFAVAASPRSRREPAAPGARIRPGASTRTNGASGRDAETVEDDVRSPAPSRSARPAGPGREQVRRPPARSRRRGGRR